VKAGFNVQKTIIIDNSPAAYMFDSDNAIPIAHYFAQNDEEVFPFVRLFFYFHSFKFKDRELLCLLPILNGLRSVYDTRSILNLRSLTRPESPPPPYDLKWPEE
jgi:TFIIF-interacting CTD phosphatase-like protein